MSLDEQPVIIKQHEEILEECEEFKGVCFHLEGHANEAIGLLESTIIKFARTEESARLARLVRSQLHAAFDAAKDAVEEHMQPTNSVPWQINAITETESPAPTRPHPVLKLRLAKFEKGIDPNDPRTPGQQAVGFFPGCPPSRDLWPILMHAAELIDHLAELSKKPDYAREHLNINRSIKLIIQATLISQEAFHRPRDTRS